MDVQDMNELEDKISVSISDDKLTAYLTVAIADDNLKCSLAQLEQLLHSYAVKHGIDYALLSEIAKDPKSFAYKKLAVAAGMKQREGRDGFIKYSFVLDDDGRKPLYEEDGKVDFKEVMSLNNVRKGQLIGERLPAEEGMNGINVYGETLVTKKGKEARFKVGKNVVLDPDQKKMYAAIDGLVTKTDGDKINVFPVYEVNGDVDYNTGNIDFVGNVVIRGNVLTGFKVKSAGDIRVIGGVEGAEIEADGSIEITAGILGHGKGLVKAGKNVKSSFIQEGNVEAGGDILVSQSIMHSQIRAEKNVICMGSKGLIVGGAIQAGERVAARTIGNTMSTQTVIEVGVLPHLRNEMIQIKGMMKQLLENMDKTDKALRLLDQLAAAGQLTQDKLEMRSKLGATKKQIIDEQAVSRERMLEIEQSLENTEKAKVDIVSSIYGGTKIVIGRYTRFVKDPISRVSFRISDGDIVMVVN